jgi:hypothetical protein
MSCWYLHYTTIFSRSIPSINVSFPQGVRMKVGSFFQQKRALSCWKPQSSLRNRRINSSVSRSCLWEFCLSLYLQDGIFLIHFVKSRLFVEIEWNVCSCLLTSMIFAYIMLALNCRCANINSKAIVIMKLHRCYA